MVAKCLVPEDYRGVPVNVPEKPSIADSLRVSAEALSKALIISDRIKRCLSFQDPVGVEEMEIRDMESQVYDISDKSSVLVMNLEWIAQHLGA